MMGSLSRSPVQRTGMMVKKARRSQNYSRVGFQNTLFWHWCDFSSSNVKDDDVKGLQFISGYVVDVGVHIRRNCISFVTELLH